MSRNLTATEVKGLNNIRFNTIQATFRLGDMLLEPVVHRVDNFIQRIRHYPADKIY